MVKTKEISRDVAELLEKMRFFDNGGETMDRYSVFYPDGDQRGMSENPTHPQGFGQWGEANLEVVMSSHKEIAFTDLPIKAKDLVINDLTEYYA